jgi:multisubunit Na+/H+ antiporter MnhC subunit
MKKMILYLGIIVAGVVVYLVLSGNSATIPRPRIKFHHHQVYHGPLALPSIEFYVYSRHVADE